MEIKEIQEAVKIINQLRHQYTSYGDKKEIHQSLQTLIQTAQDYLKLKERMNVERIEEKILVYMMNQIPSKYYSNPDKIKEFGDIIEETLAQAIAKEINK